MSVLLNSNRAVASMSEAAASDSATNSFFNLWRRAGGNVRLIGQATNLKFASVSSSTTRLIHAGKGRSPATLLLAAPFTKKVTPNAVHSGMLFGKAVVEAVPQKHENKQNISFYL